MSITEDQVKAVRQRVAKALAAEFGDEMKVDLKNIRYSDSEIRFTNLTLTPREAGKTDLDVLREKWGRECFGQGLKKDDFNREIQYGGEIMILREIHPRKRKYSIGAIQKSTGKEVLLSNRAVCMALSCLDI